jgi:drug/metabolite transporter (DMT)-like permease
MSEKYKGLIALMVANFIGGAILPSLIRTGVSSIHPIVFNFLRVGLSSIICLFLIRSHLKQLQQQWQTSLKIMFLLGLTLAGNILLFSIGVSKTTLIVSQLMYTILPITTGLVGFIWLKEKLPPQKILGAVVAMVGVITLIIFSQHQSQQLSLGSLTGNVIILAAVGCYTLFFIFSKKFSQHYTPLVLSTLSAAGSTLFFAPFAVPMLFRTGISHISTNSWLSALAISVMATIFGFLVQYGIKRLSTVTGAIITQLSPEFAALIGVLIYHEQISAVLILSLILVTSGVMLSLNTEQISVKEKFTHFINRLGLIRL